MAKVALTNIYLVNWYGFINTKIPIGRDLTLITGENECGKSTILDAMKYAFTGDVEFNKSSSSQNVGGQQEDAVLLHPLSDRPQRRDLFQAGGADAECVQPYLAGIP